MESPRGIKIPEHWLIDTGATMYWPGKEGIWVNEPVKPFLRLAVVYHGLLDIPEAHSQLARCNEKYVGANAHILLPYFTLIKDKAMAGKQLSPGDLGSPFKTEAEQEQVFNIYKPWVNEWALGSEKMLQWVVGCNVYDTTFNWLSLNRKQLRRLHNMFSGLSSKVSVPEPWGWIWPALLSGEYDRLCQTKRRLARCIIQNKGFLRVRERTLWTHAYYWIIVRILTVKQELLLDYLASNTSKKDFYLTSNDLSDKILKPFDDAIGYKRTPGRPAGA